MKEDILSVRKMKHKLVTFYLFLLVVAFFCQVTVKKEDIAACSTYSLNCLDAAKSTNQRLPISYEFTSLTQSTNSTDSPAQQALAIGLSIALILCCSCTCIIGIVITILIVACVGFSTVLAVFSPCLVALGCGACVGAVGGATAGVVGGAVGGSNRV
jgi:Flp pilus assembly protein TadB